MKYGLISASLCAVLILAASPLYADYLFMADGSIVECDIVKQKALSLTIRRKGSAKTETVNGYDILRLREKKIWEDRRWIRSPDGVLHHVFIVDETPERRLVRTRIDSSDETAIACDGSSLLVAEPKDAAAAVSVSEKAAALKWEGKETRRVYIRKKDEPFRFAGESSSGTLDIKGLDGSTRYEAVTTTVLPDNTESRPSSAFSFTTPNTPPSPPADVRAVRTESGIRLSWDGDADEDGFVERYEVYLRDEPVPERIGVVSTKEFFVSCDPSKFHRFSVVAVDDAGASSAQSAAAASGSVVPVRYSISPLLVFPLAGMSRDFSLGYGSLMGVEFPDVAVRGLGLGVTSGFLIFKGKGDVRSGDAIPLCARVSYGYAVSPRIAAVCAAEPGAWYLSSFDEAKKKSSSLCPSVSLTFTGQFIMAEKILVSVQAGGGSIYSRGSFLPYASAGVSFTMVF